MTNTLQQKIKNNFSLSSKTYDKAATLQRRVADDLCHYLMQQNLTPKNILELGAGTGYLSSKLKPAFAQSQLFITDCSESMLRMSQPKNQSSHVISFSEALPFTNHSQDLIVSNLMLQWCNLEKTVAEVTRVLTPTGHFIATTFGPHTLQQLNNAWNQLGQPDRVNTFTSIETIKKLMVQSEIKLLHIESKNYRERFDSALSLLKNLKDIGSIKKNQTHLKSLLTQHHINQLDDYLKMSGQSFIEAEYEVILIHAEYTK